MMLALSWKYAVKSNEHAMQHRTSPVYRCQPDLGCRLLITAKSTPKTSPTSAKSTTEFQGAMKYFS